MLTSGTWLDAGRPLPEMALVNHRGEPYTRESLGGRWNLLFFGFTSCPDVCPTTLAMLAGMDDALADLPEEQRPRVVFISVDPQRDTPERVAAYVEFFGPELLGVTGNGPAIDSLTRSMGVPYAISPLSDGNYTVDHSSALFLVDGAGSLRAVFSAPHTLAGLTADYRRIVETS